MQFSSEKRHKDKRPLAHRHRTASRFGRSEFSFFTAHASKWVFSLSVPHPSRAFRDLKTQQQKEAPGASSHGKAARQAPRAQAKANLT